MFFISMIAYLVMMLAFFIYFGSEQKSVKKDIKIMHERLSGNAWILFRLGLQTRFQKNFPFVVLITAILIVVPLVDLLRYWLTQDWPWLDQIDDLCIGVLIFTWVVLSLALVLKNKKMTMVIFKRINFDTKFLRQYHVVNNPYLDNKLGLVVDTFLSRIEKFNQREQQHKNLSAIYILFSFFLDLLKTNKKNNLPNNQIIFVSENSRITLDEMLKLINTYFNSFEIEIKTRHLLKFVKN